MPNINSSGDKESARIKSVQQELGDALAEVQFQGLFSCSKRYSDFPNPVLDLDGIGPIGLPLNKIQAEIIMKKCSQPRVTKGGRPLVNKRIRLPWEMDASKVKFLNPQWKPFLSKVAKEVCEGLGVNIFVAKPRFQLRKLLISAKDSHILPHGDLSEDNGKFASMLLILPSPFTGGETFVSHCGNKSCFDPSTTSFFNITVDSWYSGVNYELKSTIKSGYCLGLLIDLFHMNGNLPSLLDMGDGGVSRLRQALLSWKDQGHVGPKKIVYMLSYHYPQPNMKASDLDDEDAYRVTVLTELAKDLGYKLGLATIEHQRCGSSYDIDRREEDMDMDQFEFSQNELENLTTPIGELIKEVVPFHDRTEGIPSNLEEYFEEEEWDSQEAEDYVRLYSIVRSFRRTAIVIWPDTFDITSSE